MRQSTSHHTITNRSSISLQLYFQDIQRLEKREKKMTTPVFYQGSDLTDIQTRLVLKNLRFVISIAKQYQYTGIPLEDLIGQGNLGLITAAKQYKDVGNNFISYAVWWIREALTSAAADYSRMIRLPANRIWLLQKIFRTQNYLEQVLGREPTNREIAAELGIDDSEVDFVLQHNPIQKLALAPHEDEGGNAMEMLADHSAVATDQALEQRDFSQAIESILSVLDERERRILEMNFGLGDGPPNTLDMVAERLSITSERVRQIKRDAIRKIRRRSVVYLQELGMHT